jgi:hypothetical protein
MDFIRKHNELKKLFKDSGTDLRIPDSDITLSNIPFLSDPGPGDFFNKKDSSIKENLSFTYPVFSPPGGKSKRVILLLHGLNERSWTKYLAWGFYLSERTGSHVILFPISFHINRSPVSWKDPRIMNSLLVKRNDTEKDINLSTFANFALSERLSEDPLRFFSSGLQSVKDIVKLVNSIKLGDHPTIEKCRDVDIFSYSIGAFLAQIILMANPGDHFSDSRLFMFCGGSVFSNMHGSSKLIMDSLAYEKLYSYYINDFEKITKEKTPLSEFLLFDRLGLVFRSMIDFERLKKFRENILLRLKDQILAVTLKKDSVIPAEGVVSTLCRWNSKLRGNVQVWDFPYSYSHENPFPDNNLPSSGAINENFSKMMAAAVSFLR